MTGGRNRKQRTGGSRQQRRVSVRAIRREPIDVHKLARALLALAEAEAAAQAEHDARHQQGADQKPSDEEPGS
jgi:hypothetical protein